MSTTLTITVNFTANPASGETHFSYLPSHRHDGVVYTGGVIENEGTVAFTESGKYTLTDPNTGGTKTFTFDAVDVVPGSGLGDSFTCDDCDPYDLGTIPFPQLDGQPSVENPYKWCQQLTDPAAQGLTPEQRGRIVDPKLGLSNTTGGTPKPVSDFGDCSCGNCS